jgi:hypothetical protein
MNELQKVRLEILRRKVTEVLDELHQQCFTPDMLLTFVARHPSNPECYVMVTADDLAKVAELLEQSAAN